MIRPIDAVKTLTDQDLRDTWEWCFTQTTKLGAIKIKAAKRADVLLAEASSRGISL